MKQLSLIALSFLFLLNACQNSNKETVNLNSFKPNVLWITVEDMSPHLPSYGDSTISTPNIDRLANEGVRYGNAFSISGVCSPSRAALMTGMYPTTIGAQHMRTLKRTSSLHMIKDPDLLAIPTYSAVPSPEVKCFTEYLRADGYYCTNNSKEDYQFEKPITAWDESSGQAHWRNRPDPETPFFAVFNFTVTHESQVWVRADEPLRVDPQNVPVPPYYPDSPVIRKDIARNYDNIMVMDGMVGDLIRQLEEDALMDKTIIFFYADHGAGLPRSKRWIYDSGIKVPLIIRFPDLKGAGTIEDRLVSFVDFGPTVLSLTGQIIPDYIQGIPFLGEYEAAPRNYIFAARDRMDPALETRRAVRDKRFKYIKNYRPDEPYLKWIPYRDQMNIMTELYRFRDEGKLTKNQSWIYLQQKPEEELYDTRNDPYELTNLATDPEFAEKLMELREEHLKWKNETGDLGHIPEPELIKLLWPPDGVQPKTEKPFAEITQIEAGDNLQVELSSATEGASIAYRLDSTQQWLLYHEPLILPKESVIYTRAIRIGYLESDQIAVLINDYI